MNNRITNDPANKGREPDYPESNGQTASNEEVHYVITIKGHLDGHWSDWLGGLEIIQTIDGNSVLKGVIPDQAALHGILAQIRDLGLTLISITPQGINQGELNENSEQ